MLLFPEDLAIDAVGPDELIENGLIEADEFHMGTYTNAIKGQRDKDL